MDLFVLFYLEEKQVYSQINDTLTKQIVEDVVLVLVRRGQDFLSLISCKA